MNSLCILHGEVESTRRKLVLACFKTLSWVLGGGVGKAGNTCRVVHGVCFVSIFSCEVDSCWLNLQHIAVRSLNCCEITNMIQVLKTEKISLIMCIDGLCH